MKHLKLFEQFEDDPFGEEIHHWDEINVGDKVRCIDDNGTELFNGQIYDVESTSVGIFSRKNFLEIVGGNGERYYHTRFEKIR